MAHWIIEDHGFGGVYYTCSECGGRWCNIYNTKISMEDNCPKCGAPINVDENEYIEEKKKKKKNDTYRIEIPGWCKIGLLIDWHAPHITGHDWVREQIVAFGYDGFFHRAHNCPMYFSKFDEYGKTIRLSIMGPDIMD